MDENESVGWHLIDVEKYVRESTLSGNAGGGFPKPFIFGGDDEEDGEDPKKHKAFPLLRPALADLEVPSEEMKVWRHYLRR